MYTLREFRANTKQAFDDAAQGHEVVIDRSGFTYQLVALAGPPLPGHAFESIPRKKPELKSKAIIERNQVIPCKHGADPKFCKHAKNGVCK